MKSKKEKRLVPKTKTADVKKFIFAKFLTPGINLNGVFRRHCVSGSQRKKKIKCNPKSRTLTIEFLKSTFMFSQRTYELVTLKFEAPGPGTNDKNAKKVVRERTSKPTKSPH